MGSDLQESRRNQVQMRWWGQVLWRRMCGRGRHLLRECERGQLPMPREGWAMLRQSKCCKPKGPQSGWYPVSKGTQCREESVKCRNRAGKGFECASGDQCCGDICVSKNDVCCEN